MSSNTPSTPRGFSPSSSEALPSIIQVSRPYLTSLQTKELDKQTNNGTGAREQQMKFHAFSWIMSVGNQLRFPIRTMGSAMILFQRFYLFNSLQDFPSTSETAQACLFVAAKMEDTLKKLKEILVASYYLKYPNGPNINMDSQIIEDQRRRIISLERQVLETMSFDFRVKHPQPYVMKFCRYLKYPVNIAELSWLIAADSYKTLVPLKNTPHTVALGCIYIAGALSNFDTSNINPDEFIVDKYSYENVILELLEFYIDFLSHTSISNRINDPNQFMSIRIKINKQISERQYHRTNKDKIKCRDYTMGDRGTVRYVLDWEREKAESDALAS
ncbi:cyclin-like protein [Dipodascopsis uninucleata]